MEIVMTFSDCRYPHTHKVCNCEHRMVQQVSVIAMKEQDQVYKRPHLQVRDWYLVIGTQGLLGENSAGQCGKRPESDGTMLLYHHFKLNRMETYQYAQCWVGGM
jgi:hypothetical protein